MSYETLNVETRGAVRRIALNRPKKLNALSGQLLAELREALQAAADDGDCRCVLLTGEGRGFSSGADLTDTAVNMKPGQPFDFGAALDDTYHPVVRLIRAMEKPVVAAINGTAAGAGCNIALAADIVIAARSAKLIQAFIRIGLVPDAGGTWSIPRLIGRARALRWMMTGEAIDARTAEQWGLVTYVHADADFPAAVQALAGELAQAPTAALGRIKALVDAAERSDLSTQMEQEATQQKVCGQGADFMEGVMAFMQKRPAKFRGE